MATFQAPCHIWRFDGSKQQNWRWKPVCSIGLTCFSFRQMLQTGFHLHLQILKQAVRKKLAFTSNKYWAAPGSCGVGTLLVTDRWMREEENQAIAATTMVCTTSAGNYKCASLVSGCFSWFVTQVFHCWITASVIDTLHDPADIGCHLLGDFSCLLSVP